MMMMTLPCQKNSALRYTSQWKSTMDPAILLFPEIYRVLLTWSVQIMLWSEGLKCSYRSLLLLHYLSCTARMYRL